MGGYFIKPLKIIFETTPKPHLVFIEALSKPVGSIKHMTGEMARNLLIQLGYVVNRIIGLVKRDPVINKPLLQLQFDINTNMTVKDGKLMLSAGDSLVYRSKDKSLHVIHVI